MVHARLQKCILDTSLQLQYPYLPGLNLRAKETRLLAMRCYGHGLPINTQVLSRARLARSARLPSDGLLVISDSSPSLTSPGRHGMAWHGGEASAPLTDIRRFIGARPSYSRVGEKGDLENEIQRREYRTELRSQAWPQRYRASGEAVHVDN